MDIAPERVLILLGADETGLDEADLARRLGEPASATDAGRALGEVLAALTRVGLVERRNGRYARRPMLGHVVGRLRFTFSGRCFVRTVVAGGHDTGDVSIRDDGRGDALPGDTVLARVTRRAGDWVEGEVRAVLRRASTTVMGRYVGTAREAYVLPIDERFPHEILVDPGGRKAETGDVVTVEITRFPLPNRAPRGRVLEVIGSEADPGLDVEIVVRKHGIPHEFPAGVLEEAETVPTEVGDADRRGRVDLRSTLTVTIDGETARDFDDAISIERSGPGRWSLGVHIADVSHYVREGTPLDAEASKRATSVYFPDRAVPMLPERLSNGICSLNPKVDRLAMSALMEVDQRGRVVDYWLGATVIRSDERMTYTAVNAVLKDEAGPGSAPRDDLPGMFREMEELAKALIARRTADGAIDFNLPEAVVHFDDEGHIGGIFRAERNIAHRIIEQFMLLANETVARHLTALGVPLLYRIHEVPDPRKVEEFAEIVHSFGYAFAHHTPLRSADYQELARRIAGRPEERMLSSLMLRSLRQARYSPANLGHFGIATDCYTHFTSPIRRYPDLIVHRILREILEHGDPGPLGARTELGARRAAERRDWPVLSAARVEALERQLESIGDQSSERERIAQEAERELLTWKKAEYMAEQLGEEFDGIITGVKEYGLYVELIEVFVEGLVHVSTLVDDLYLLRERSHSLVGQRNGRVFRLGDAVRARVDRVDRGRHLVDFSIVEGGRYTGRAAGGPDRRSAEPARARRRKRRR